jgi:hypothetical protein
VVVKVVTNNKATTNMTTLRRIILLSFLGGAVMLKLPVVHSFSNTKQHTQPSRVLNYMAPPSGTKSSVAEIEAESEQLRKEIEELTGSS